MLRSKGVLSAENIALTQPKRQTAGELIAQVQKGNKGTLITGKLKAPLSRGAIHSFNLTINPGANKKSTESMVLVCTVPNAKV